MRNDPDRTLYKGYRSERLVKCNSHGSHLMVLKKPDDQVSGYLVVYILDDNLKRFLTVV